MVIFFFFGGHLCDFLLYHVDSNPLKLIVELPLYVSENNVFLDVQYIICTLSGNNVFLDVQYIFLSFLQSFTEYILLQFCQG